MEQFGGDIMGGFCPGGFCPGGFCPRGDFVQGDFVRGILSGGIQKWPALFRNPQSFVDYSMERSIRYNFFKSIQHKLSSDYSSDYCLNIYFSRRFPYIYGPSFLRTNPCKMSIFERSVTCSFFFRHCTHILTRTQGETFEEMFLVKIASKGTFLTIFTRKLSGVITRRENICLRLQRRGCSAIWS